MENELLQKINELRIDLSILEERFQNEKELLEDKFSNLYVGDKISIVNEINGYDGSFEDLRFEYNDEDFFNTYFYNKPMELVRAIYYGDYNFNDGYVTFNSYGNLVTYDEYDVGAEIDSQSNEIVEYLIENDYKLNDSNITDLLCDYKELEEEFENLEEELEELEAEFEVE